MISASLSLSLPRLGWKSTSTPRSLKIWTAAGESASEMRTRGVMVSAHKLVAGDTGFLLPSPLGVGSGEAAHQCRMAPYPDTPPQAGGERSRHAALGSAS